MSSTPTVHSSWLRLALARSDSAERRIGVRVLGGNKPDDVIRGAVRCGQAGQFELFSVGAWLIGSARARTDAPGSWERETRRLYDELLQAAEGRHLSRIWNYVPAINEIGPDRLENYRAFCRGRSLAFENAFGADFKRYLPAASAVGSEDAMLTVVFAASTVAPRHVENPRQLPAYDYPPDYGPRAPSFARASVVAEADQTTVFISGTSAIAGHATVAPFETTRQLGCTLQNLREIGVACGVGADLGLGRARERHFKVYLRNPGDQVAVAAVLESRLLRTGDEVSYLRADICRRELNVEIEVTLRGRF